MGGVFVGPLSAEDEPLIAQESLVIDPGYAFVISGSVAIRLLLRGVGLQPGDRVAIPALICPSVVWAIRAEGLTPAFMDVDGDGFWMLFDRDHWEKCAFQAILLPHMYGLLHPQTADIMAFAEDRGLPLFHDAAQSHGLLWQGEPLITCNQGGFVSFGAGKSTTAAGGALVHGLPEAMIHRLQLTHYSRFNPYARRFMEERMGQQVVWRWYHRPPFGVCASRLQVRAARYLLGRFSVIEERRRSHWQQLETLIGGELLGLSAARRSCYKYVIHRDTPTWSPPPQLLGVAWRRVEKYPAESDLPNYTAWKGYLYELSTERSLAFFRDHWERRQGKVER
ncbi:MAG: DegT/DnrJ/EryC1/StrS aminotransferase family protein [Nitrospirae bacterium]|nr:DegT/DnrJ/EryC1/StrS aminotransferase family protein [Magnetococcales bacterium]